MGWQRQDVYCSSLAACTQAECCIEFNHCQTKKDKNSAGTPYSCPSNWQRQEQYCDSYAATCDPSGSSCPALADCTEAQCCIEFNHCQTKKDTNSASTPYSCPVTGNDNS